MVELLEDAVNRKMASFQKPKISDAVVALVSDIFTNAKKEKLSRPALLECLKKRNNPSNVSTDEFSICSNAIRIVRQIPAQQFHALIVTCNMHIAKEKAKNKVAELKALKEPTVSAEEKKGQEQEDTYVEAYDQAAAALAAATTEAAAARKAKKLAEVSLTAAKNAFEDQNTLQGKKDKQGKLTSVVMAHQATDSVNSAPGQGTKLERLHGYAVQIAAIAESVAAHTQSQVDIATIKKQAIASVAGREQAATIGAKAEVNQEAMLRNLGGLSATPAAVATKSAPGESKIEAIKLSASMAHNLALHLLMIKILAEKSTNPCDKQLSNGYIDEFKKIIQEFKIPVDLDSMKEEVVPGGTDQGISEPMQTILRMMLDKMKEVARTSETEKKNHPDSKTLSAIADGDKEQCLKLQKTILESIPQNNTTSQKQPAMKL